MEWSEKITLKLVSEYIAHECLCKSKNNLCNSKHARNMYISHKSAVFTYLKIIIYDFNCGDNVLRIPVTDFCILGAT